MFYWENGNMKIHPTAIVHKDAKIGEDVFIGPYSIVGPNVEIGSNCCIYSNVVIDGYTVIGSGNRIFNGASLGLEPQDLKYNGEKSYLFIGNNNTIREYVTINRGTDGGGGKTEVGDNNLIMAYSHIAHDCKIGNNVIIANSVNMAGHVVIEDYAVISGAAGIIQHVRIGHMAMIGGMSKISKDLPPYLIADESPLRIRGVNVIGLKRNGINDETIKNIEKAFKILYHSGLTVNQAAIKIEEQLGQNDEIQRLLSFVRSSGKGIIR
jgi:UDP-N-acetylglucosamine acyltransferase